MIRNIICTICIMLTVTGCTRDDICPADTPTTPLLQIQFRDITDRTLSKAVTTLRVVTNDADTLEAFVGESDTLIGIPLNTLATISEFQFINNSADSTTTNTDILLFQYSTQDIYVNRACSFKTIYEEFQVNLVAEPGDTNWIKDLDLLTTTIADETDAHLTIFH